MGPAPLRSQHGRRLQCPLLAASFLRARSSSAIWDICTSICSTCMCQRLLLCWQI